MGGLKLQGVLNSLVFHQSVLKPFGIFQLTKRESRFSKHVQIPFKLVSSSFHYNFYRRAFKIVQNSLHKSEKTYVYKQFSHLRDLLKMRLPIIDVSMHNIVAKTVVSSARQMLKSLVTSCLSKTNLNMVSETSL